MKQFIRYITAGLGIASLFVLLPGCSNYIDLEPLDEFSDQGFWTNESKVETFSWGFYDEFFVGYGNGGSFGKFYFTSFTDDQVGQSFQDFAKNAPASDGNWSFAYIRKANLVLNRVGQVPMEQEAKNHWAGVARFFRALNYYQLVKKFGDVPWYSNVLDISEDSAIYKPRDPRDKVMDSVLSDLDFAIANLRDKGAAKVNTVNKDVALALKSRICLYEGTYAKYNEQNNERATRYLQESKEASAAVMEAGYVLTPDYTTVYNSMDLAGNTEVLLYKQYEPSVLTQPIIGYTNSSTIMRGLSKDAVESYVCQDGLPIALSPDYQGDGTIEDVRADRDKRLQETISDFYCYLGARVTGLSSTTGYRPAKFLQPAATQLAPYNETDAPLFWLAEVLENYAEAAAELDELGGYTLTQNDLDISINKLRARADVQPLEVSGHQGTAIGGHAFVDPEKDPDVTSLIWEIRRDRRVELMMDGFRFDDLIRWHKLDYMDTEKNPDIILGAKVAANDEITRNAQGYIVVYPDKPTRTVQDRDYLSPIPTGEIALYPDGVLKQNPGW